METKAIAAAAGLKPNGPRIGKAGGSPGAVRKHGALADITNTGRPRSRSDGVQEKPLLAAPPPCQRSVDFAEILKENATLLHLLGEKTKIIELSGMEMQKLRFALHKAHLQNSQLAQANSQMLMELNLGKDRLKALQHELACTAAVLRVKTSELEEKNKLSKPLPKGVNSEAVCSEVAAVRAHSIDNKPSNANLKRSAETQCTAFVPSTMNQQEVPQGQANKRKSASRGANKRKRKSESCEARKDSKMENALSGEPLHEHRRESVRRRSARLNPASCEPIEDPSKTEENSKISACSLVDEPLHEDVLSAPSGSTISIEQGKNGKHNDPCGSLKSLDHEQVERRRSSAGRPPRRATEKVISYKEIPLNVKMRRVD